MKHDAVHFREVTSDAFAKEASALMETWIEETLAMKDRCILALSGGSTPKSVYASLAAKEIDWKRVDIVLVDERCTNIESADSNQKMIRDVFTNAHLLAPDPSLPAHEAADAYEKSLLAIKGGGTMDIVVLGIGEDGHIASLFPPVTDEGLTRMGVVHTTTDRFAVRDRISMSLPLLQKSNRKLLLLSGDAKKKILAQCMAAEKDLKRWPLHALLDTTLTVLCC